MIKYLNSTSKDNLFLLAENLHVIKWYLDAQFSVHPEFQIHTGGSMTLGVSAIQYISFKK